MLPTMKRLAELLIKVDVIDERQLLTALGHQRQWGVNELLSELMGK